MAQIKQLKRLIHKCNNELSRDRFERSKELFNEAWQIKKEIGEQLIIETDFQLMKSIWTLREAFYSTHKPDYGTYHDAEYKQLHLQESDYRTW